MIRLRQSSPSCLAALQQQHHQAALERGQFAAVALLQDRRQFAAETPEARQRVAVRDVQQSVEELLPQVAVRVPEEQKWKKSDTRACLMLTANQKLHHLVFLPLTQL